MQEVLKLILGAASSKGPCLTQGQTLLRDSHTPCELIQTL